MNKAEYTAQLEDTAVLGELKREANRVSFDWQTCRRAKQKSIPQDAFLTDMMTKTYSPICQSTSSALLSAPVTASTSTSNSLPSAVLMSNS